MTRPRSRMESMELYYAGGGVELYHGSALDDPEKWTHATALITDPPYGIDYRPIVVGRTTSSAIAGDKTVAVRDAALAAWHEANHLEKPAAVFGSWKAPRPPQTRHRLIWQKAGNIMNHIVLPWRPVDEEIYIWGKGWARSTRAPGSVIVTTENRTSETRRLGHPTPKPVDLLQALMTRLAPVEGGHVIADPFAGSGSTLVAAASLGHKAIGVELDERYCEQIARRVEYFLANGEDAPRSVIVRD